VGGAVEGSGERVGPPGGRVRTAAIDHLDRKGEELPPPGRVPGRGHEAVEARAGEEPQVSTVEDAAAVVVEAAEHDAQPRVPVPEVRDTSDDRTAGSEAGAEGGEHPF